MTSRPAWAVALALVLGAASVAGAQGAPGQGPGKGRGPREDAFKIVDAYIVSNLQESLGLSNEQFVKMLPLVKKLQDDRRSLGQRRMRALLEMKRLLGTGAATESQLAPLLAEVKAVEGEESQVLKKDREAIDQVLSPVQQAKFRVLEVEVDRKIRALMSQLRERGQGRRQRPGGKAGEGAEEDED